MNIINQKCICGQFLICDTDSPTCKNRNQRPVTSTNTESQPETIEPDKGKWSKLNKDDFFKLIGADWNHANANIIWDCLASLGYTISKPTPPPEKQEEGDDSWPFVNTSRRPDLSKLYLNPKHDGMQGEKHLGEVNEMVWPTPEEIDNGFRNSPEPSWDEFAYEVWLKAIQWLQSNCKSHPTTQPHEYKKLVEGDFLHEEPDVNYPITQPQAGKEELDIYDAVRLNRVETENDQLKEKFKELAKQKNAYYFEIKELQSQLTQQQSVNSRLVEALEKIIQMNRQQAEDQYGDPDMAETWSCVSVARAALSSINEKININEGD